MCSILVLTEKLEQYGTDMDNSIINIEGVSFRAPTTIAEEHAAVFMDLPRKRNDEETFD